eukprot:CAMPEP_0201544486 /NCGR_PEP_ID=MMETSP0173_2-20130828/1103_1 /ASSEMBLY_ACC=CAM_ASM_000268 /TAXON_ID=218659 /ORGANISM="Vexillifera sp., Strain DIVA3 564/2" /LENGTH=157 /DNA_ID=CAMNT_0047952615 /DNA_START=20 /DNA_END=489 /DNA_ORIENTATION=+
MDDDQLVAAQSTTTQLVVAVLSGFVFGGVVSYFLNRSRSSSSSSSSSSIASSSTLSSLTNLDYKQVLVVRMDIGMKRGKAAAQCCHASLGAYKRALKQTPMAVKAWETFGTAKVTLKVNSFEEIKQVEAAAKEKGLPTYLVQDAGRTQIPAGTYTVL